MLKNKLILSLSALSLCSVFLFSACGDKKSASVSSSASNVSVELSSSSETVDKSSNNKGISVDKGMLSVEIVFPAIFFEDTTEDEVITIAKESGMEAIKNDIIKVITKYMDIDSEGLDIQITQTESEGGNGTVPVLCANIPVKDLRKRS